MSKEIIAKKAAIVEEVFEKFQSASSAVVVDYRGLTVEEVTDLRKQLRDAGVKMSVIKNKILDRAVEGTDYEDLKSTFVGPTAVIYTDNADDVTEPARIVSKYEDDFDVIEIKGGMLEGKLTSKDEIKELAAIPGREGLLSMLVSVLQAPVRDFAYAVKAVAESKDEDSAE